MTRWLPIAGLRHAVIPGRRSLNSALNRAVSGAGLMLELAATTVATAGSAALLGEPVWVSRTLRDVGADADALIRAAAAVTLEAVGGEPARRCSSNGPRCWIEVRGLRNERGSDVVATVLTSLRSTPGVQSAFVDRRIDRVVVTVDPGGPGPAQLCRIIADAERRTGVSGRKSASAGLPGDDAVLMARVARRDPRNRRTGRVGGGLRPAAAGPAQSGDCSRSRARSCAAVAPRVGKAPRARGRRSARVSAQRDDCSIHGGTDDGGRRGRDTDHAGRRGLERANGLESTRTRVVPRLPVRRRRRHRRCRKPATARRVR